MSDDPKNDDRPYAGTGIVTAIEPGEKTSVVVIDGVQPKLKWPRKINVLNGDILLTAAKDALASGQLVSYKIEKNARGFRDLTQLDFAAGGSSPEARPPAAAPTSTTSDANGHKAPERPTGGVEESWQYAAAVGTVDLAYELLADVLGEVTKPALAAFAKRLLACADEAQAALTGKVDRAAQSHTRARGALRTVMGTNTPAPIGNSDDEAWDKWQAKATTRTVVLLQIAKDLS